MKKRRKRRKRGRAKCIRTYRRIAMQSHGTCDFCRHEIMAGDEYEGSVWVNGAELFVKKEHMYCWPEDDLWDRYKDFEEEIDKNTGEFLALDKAA